MIDAKTLDDITGKLARLLPGDLGILKADLENNIRATLQGIFQKMDLVTREEFDVQCELLARTQKKVQELEQTLAELQQR